jgi:predicted RecA/RadA family phage recombinase
MQNFVKDGFTKDYTNVGATVIKSGDIVPLKNWVGIAYGDIPPGGLGALALSGVFIVPKLAEAIADGDMLYIDDTTGKATLEVSTAGAGSSVIPHVPLGIAYEAAAATDGYVKVKING